METGSETERPKEPLKARRIADGLEDFEAGSSKFHSIYAYPSVHR